MESLDRNKLVSNLKNSDQIWDVVIIGGGASGLGVALDAVSRGFKTLLLEQNDFAKGTSSRSTKLVHGGVRYLAQGNIDLVKEALYERGLLLKNAAHLVKNETFIIPNYNWWGGIYYKIGLSLYDFLAGSKSFGKAKYLTKAKLLEKMPELNKRNLRSGVSYQDGQFDDARLAINLAQTCIEKGATLLNYFKVCKLLKEQEQISGLEVVDQETGLSYNVRGKVVVNATGVFVDEILKMDTPTGRPIVRPSQGVHLVLDRSFCSSEDALMIPKTDDGRVLFAVPWHNKLILGTTDTPLEEHSLEPRALDQEIEFILKTASKYLQKQPTRADVLSVFAGLRPLAASNGDSSKTKEISRSHKIIVSPSGLLTLTGGKWTTFRKMGEDTLDKAIKLGKLPAFPSKSKDISIHGNQQAENRESHLYVYGADKEELLAFIKSKPEWANPITANSEYLVGEIAWAVKAEMARTVEDFLARRTRVLFLDAKLAIEMAPKVAEVMAAELNRPLSWQEDQVNSFTKLAKGYLI
ncbi:MAG TPA: glycerol-3-phosphate dehydrogenase/oxidase [Pelobium sp.]